MTYTPNPHWKLSAENAINIPIAAEMLGVKKMQIYRWMRSGRIRWGYIGHGHPKASRFLFKPDVEEIVRERAKLSEMEGS